MKKTFWIFLAFVFCFSSFLLFQNYPAFARPVVPAPEFTGTDLKGKVHRLADYEGKTLAVYFWATWCPYCRKDVSAMIETFQQYQNRDVRILSVSLDQDLAQLEAFVEKQRIPYPVVFSGGSWADPVAQAFSIDSLPSFVLINPQGHLVAYGNGADRLASELKKRL